MDLSSTNLKKATHSIRMSRLFYRLVSRWASSSGIEHLAPELTYYHKYRLYTIRTIVNRWAPASDNNTKAYVDTVSRLTGIDPDEPIGIPSEQPSRWIALGLAMAIQENGTSSLNRSTLVALLLGENFAMLRGWALCRADAQSGKL